MTLQPLLVNMKVTFAHGLWSSTESSKVKHMRSLGWEVLAVDMHHHGWNQQEQTQAVIDAIEQHGPFDLLIGSSFGGLATANAAALRPDLDLRLLLLAPAFGYHSLLNQQLTNEEMSNWRASNQHSFHPPGWEKPVVLPYSFAEAAEDVSWPILTHPTVVLHGVNDDVVPLTHSERAVESAANAQLVKVDDGHRLHDSLHLLPSLAERLLNR